MYAFPRVSGTSGTMPNSIAITVAANTSFARPSGIRHRRCGHIVPAVVKSLAELDLAASRRDARIVGLRAVPAFASRRTGAQGRFIASMREHDIGFQGPDGNSCGDTVFVL